MQSSGVWSTENCGQPFGSGYRYVCEGPTRQPPGACAAGQFEGPDGGCYVLESTPATHAQAEAACQARGLGWDLADVATQAQNDFLTGLLSCADVWVQRPSSYQNYVPAAAGVNCPRVRQTGGWTDENCGTALPYVCEGPQLSPDETVTDPLQQVTDAGQCAASDEWYFDDPVSPTAISLCPATCDRVRTRPTGRVSIEIGCPIPPPSYLQTTYVDEYESDCPPGSQVQWSFMTYDATIPADASIEFSARTAGSVGGLASASYVPLLTAFASSQTCALDTVGTPGCPVDWFALIGHPDQRNPVLG
jgi:hypothetical protein